MASINPPAVSPGDDTEVAWANRVVSHVVATFATVAERDQQIPSPEPGRVVYLESTKQLEAWDGTAWVPVGHGVYLPLAGGTLTGDLRLATIRTVGGQPVLNAPAGGPVYLYDGKNPSTAVTITDTALQVRDRVIVNGPGISYEGSTHGGGGVNAIGFRWAGGLLKAVVDNVHTYTLANDAKFASYLPLAGGKITGSSAAGAVTVRNLSVSAATNPPPSAIDGDLWVDQTAKALKIRSAGSWVTIIQGA